MADQVCVCAWAGGGRKIAMLSPRHMCCGLVPLHIIVWVVVESMISTGFGCTTARRDSFSHNRTPPQTERAFQKQLGVNVGYVLLQIDAWVIAIIMHTAVGLACITPCAATAFARPPRRHQESLARVTTRMWAWAFARHATRLKVRGALVVSGQRINNTTQAPTLTKSALSPAMLPSVAASCKVRDCVMIFCCEHVVTCVTIRHCEEHQDASHHHRPPRLSALYQKVPAV